MKRIPFALMLTGAFILPASAHHSGTMFDPDREVTFEGVVNEFQYTNPHSWLLVDVTNEDGTVTTWGFETAGPLGLRFAGIRRSDLPPGTNVTVTGRPMKDGRPGASFVRAVRGDGKVFDPGARAEGFTVPE